MSKCLTKYLLEHKQNVKFILMWFTNYELLNNLLPLKYTEKKIDSIRLDP